MTTSNKAKSIVEKEARPSVTVQTHPPSKHIPGYVLTIHMTSLNVSQGLVGNMTHQMNA